MAQPHRESFNKALQTLFCATTCKKYKLLETMQPFEPFDVPEPPRKKGNIMLPVGINAVVMLAAYSITSAQSGGHTGDTALEYFFVLVGLFVLNILAAVVAALMGKTQTALGLCFAVLGIFLIGLGTCAYSLEHLRVN